MTLNRLINLQSALIVILLSVGISSDCNCGCDNGPMEFAEHDGQPGCQTRYEFTRHWRHNYEKRNYWECQTWNSPAVLRKCPSGRYFQDIWQSCLPYNQWQWTPFSEPPSRPGSVLGENCQEINLPELPDECSSVHPPPDTNGNSTDSPPGPIGICPGAKDHQYAPGKMDCLPPVCTEGKWEENILYPTRDPQSFYQCHSPDIVKVMPCAPGTCFDFSQQVCVHIVNWTNNCN